jgi:hypothetical protein
MALAEPQGSSAGAVKEMEMRLREIRARKLTIIGVGNSLRGDDFAGSLVVKKLMSRLNQVIHRSLVLDAGFSASLFHIWSHVLELSRT